MTSAAAAPMLSVSNVSKHYGRGHDAALKDVSLAVQRGEFLVLLGPSGSGKTTLLRAIAGLETIDGGEIRLKNRLLNTVLPRKRNLALVFQDYALYPHMLVGENIGYNMRIRKIPKGEIEQRVIQTARMLGIEDLLDRKPAALSGGERQRVAVARAITRDADILLMDEPLSNLDAQIREHVRVELRELQLRLGLTTIYVTHDQVEAMVMADRVVVLHRGVIQQVGTPNDIYEQPANLFCAQFIGSPRINEVECQLRAGVSGLECRIGSVTILLSPESSAEDVNEEWRSCVLAFRSEDTRLVSNGGLSASMRLLENRGADRYLVARLSDDLEQAQRSSELRVRVSGDYSVGGPVFRFVPTRVYLFDPSSGDRVCIATCDQSVLQETVHLL